MPGADRHRRCMSVVVTIETGGRWSDESVGFIRQLAFAKAREVASYLRWHHLAWERRWTRYVGSLSFTSLVEPESQCSTWCRTDDEAPQLTDLFHDPR